VAWRYLFGLLAHFYSFSPDDVMNLTPKQIEHYSEMIGYVNPMARKEGDPPAPLDVVQGMAERAGISAPTSVGPVFEDGDLVDGHKEQTYHLMGDEAIRG
jgi:hypothetical protein